MMIFDGNIETEVIALFGPSSRGFLKHRAREKFRNNDVRSAIFNAEDGSLDYLVVTSETDLSPRRVSGAESEITDYFTPNHWGSHISRKHGIMVGYPAFTVAPEHLGRIVSPAWDDDPDHLRAWWWEISLHALHLIPDGTPMLTLPPRPE